MNRARPTNNTLHCAGVGVRDQLNDYCLIAYSVHTFVLVNGRRSDRYVSAGDTTDNVRNVRYRTKCDVNLNGFRSSINCCFADAKQIIDNQLETSARK